jgi:hypothetical protein
MDSPRASGSGGTLLRREGREALVSGAACGTASEVDPPNQVQTK